MKTARRTKHHIRWMIRRDMLDVIEIEELCFPSPWNEFEFIHHLQQRNTIDMVAERNDAIVGYMVYELHKKEIVLINLCVHPRYRLEGAGTSLINKLNGKLSTDRRCQIRTEVSETNLSAQLFFKALGFITTDVLRDFYDTPDGDAIRFVCRHEWNERT